MKAFVTGGSGFIGQRLISKLKERGYDVYALARSERSAAILTQLGATVVPGDITDTNSMRAGMSGSDVVFHIAAWYKIGGSATDRAKAEAINVGGTRKVLRLAHELGVPKIVYTSTVAVFGDTHGELVDESFHQGSPFLTEYDRTKWLAHYKVAVPLIEKGAPIIIVMPGAVYGPGDSSTVADMMRLFYRGLPILPGPEMTVTYAHVDDIAEGHILAAEKGKVGESYVLAGPAIPLGEMVDFWGHLTGKSAPMLRIPGAFLRPLKPVVELFEQAVALPPAFSAETVGMLGATYMARSDKARRELGWQTRPLQIGMIETFDWIRDTEQMPEHVSSAQTQKIALAAVGASLLFLVLWLIGRKRQK